MIEAALSYISPEDRETWVRMGMAIKSELAEAGFPIWDAWSQQSDRYKAADARSVWRSMKGAGIRIGTLYIEARRAGWVGEASSAARPEPSAREKSQQARRLRESADRAQELRHRAQDLAQLAVKSSTIGPNAYLARKGHPNTQALNLALVLDTYLIVPMRDVQSGKLESVQSISYDGTKKFLYGGRAKGCAFVMGSSGKRVLCEGFATALSVRSAMQSLHIATQIYVCFSAHNVAHIAGLVGGFVVADNDASGTGLNYATRTGLPYWMPPALGDANDYHQATDVRTLALSLQPMMRRK